MTSAKETCTIIKHQEQRNKKRPVGEHFNLSGYLWEDQDSSSDWKDIEKKMGKFNMFKIHRLKLLIQRKIKLT